MSILESLFGIEALEDPQSHLADQLIKRYMLAETKKDAAEQGLGMVFGHDKADDIESKLDLALKRQQLGLKVDTSDLEEEPGALRRLAPYAAASGGAALLGSSLLGKGLSSIFRSKTGGLAPHFKEAFLHGGSEPSASIFSDIIRRRRGA